MRFVALFVFILALAAPVGVDTVATGTMTAARAGQALFSALEKALIKEFFHKQASLAGDAGTGKKGKKGKKDKAKGGDVPSGLAMQLERNGTLPPGLAKKALPPGLAGALPPPPPGQQRLIVDNDVLLIEAATGLILDIIKDVL